MLRILQTLWDTGVRLRCPVCEQGRLFATLFKMNKVCPHCGVRFERFTGEEVGGMTISIVVTTAIFLIGYIASEQVTELPVWVHLVIWLTFAVVFPVVFYRYSRAFWVAALYLTGDVSWDKEAYRETDVSIVDAFFNRQPPDAPTRTKENSEDENEGSAPLL